MRKKRELSVTDHYSRRSGKPVDPADMDALQEAELVDLGQLGRVWRASVVTLTPEGETIARHLALFPLQPRRLETPPTQSAAGLRFWRHGRTRAW